MNNKIRKVHTITDISISGILLAIGVGLIFVNEIVGIFLIITGIALLIFFKAGYKYDNQNTILKHKSLELSRKCQQSILDFLEGKTTDFESITGNEGGCILLEVWYNKSKGEAFAQLFTFQEMNYHKSTEIIELPSESAKTLMEKL